MCAPVQQSGHYARHYSYLFLSFIWALCFSPGMGCRRVVKFYMGSYVTTKLGFQPKNNFSPSICDFCISIFISLLPHLQSQHPWCLPYTLTFLFSLLLLLWLSSLLLWARLASALSTILGLFLLDFSSISFIIFFHSFLASSLFN